MVPPNSNKLLIKFSQIFVHILIFITNFTFHQAFQIIAYIFYDLNGKQVLLKFSIKFDSAIDKNYCIFPILI